MMFTDGKRIYSKDFQAIPGQFSLNQPVFSFIIPDPAKALNYYVFVVDNNNEIHYQHVDHSQPNGIGVVDQGDQLLRSNADHHFTAVKRLYGDGYWLITHTRGSDEFVVYSVTKSGISSTGVTSNTGTATSTVNVYTYGNMVSDKQGSRILHCFSKLGSGSHGELFNFDKQCGTLSLSQTLEVNSSAYCCQGAFSLNDKYVYVAPGIRQYDLSDVSPILKGSFVSGSGAGESPKMALAPNGILYLSRGDNGNVTPKVCTIEGANTANPILYFDKVNLNPNPDYRYVENFPMFIMDWTEPTQDPNYPFPDISIVGGCLGSPTEFRAAGNFQYDSVKWDFGDGASSIQKNTKHQFQSVNSYQIVFHWYLCGNEYTINQYTWPLTESPEFSFGSDTLLCASTQLDLIGPANATSYLWEDGSNSTSKRIGEPGLYWLKAGASNCYFTDSIYVSFRPDVLVELGTGFQLCPYDSQLVRLDAGKGFEEYRWTPTGDTTQWIDVKVTGDYYVVVRDFYGCPGNDGATVERRCPVYLEIPNAFTPNSDGINDVFYVVANDVVEMDLKIYNRWGSEIYQSQSITDTWDGLVKEKPVPEGVYMVLLSYSGYENGQLKRFHQRIPLHLIR